MSKSETVPNSVTLDALLTAVRNAVDSGRIGTPVNVRLHWQFSETELKQAAVITARVADVALTLEEPAWRIRAGKSYEAKGRILNLLGEDREGRTVLATLCRSESPEFALTVFGNHGTLRLENTGLDEGSLEVCDVETAWHRSLFEAIG